MPEAARSPQPGRASRRGVSMDRVGFRLAAFGAVLVVLLSAGFGFGRLTATAGTGDPAADFQVGGQVRTAAFTATVN